MFKALASAVRALYFLVNAQSCADIVSLKPIRIKRQPLADERTFQDGYSGGFIGTGDCPQKCNLNDIHKEPRKRVF